jgi:hypothetical protein
MIAIDSDSIGDRFEVTAIATGDTFFGCVAIDYCDIFRQRR